ncbi:hypothetical protein ACTZWW_04245 [Salinarimonas sp. NSM]|uniref:hypothetical protein n=1 Tax=Salinarimonas sp. NSM TaxID=3458003 RepID=UPI0040374113
MTEGPKNLQDAAIIIADLLASSLYPLDGTWRSAREPKVWERSGLNWLAANADLLPGCNAWTAAIVREGYPTSAAGDRCGKFWRPPELP